MRLIYEAEIYKEGDIYVGRCRELDVSSFGDTPQAAKESLKEAIEAFMEGCRALGTLEEVLGESGFTRAGDAWRLRERTSEEMAATIP